jgi:ferredoxin
MADNNSRLPQNTPGPWYVDSNCIDCDLCRGTAPTVFRRDEDNGNSIVFHQPETAEELNLAEEARENCPVEAIGSDGAVLETEAKPVASNEAAANEEASHG